MCITLVKWILQQMISQRFCTGQKVLHFPFEQSQKKLRE